MKSITSSMSVLEVTWPILPSFLYLVTEATNILTLIHSNLDFPKEKHYIVQYYPLKLCSVLLKH